jgi:2-aminobenzoate-CoA ligase
MPPLSRPTEAPNPAREPSLDAPYDTFARDRLPPTDLWPDLLFEIPRYRFQGPLNVAVELVDLNLARGRGDHPCLIDAAMSESIPTGNCSSG